MPDEYPMRSTAFPVTRWSLVGRAGGGSDEAISREALGELVGRYLPALKAHLVFSKRLYSDDADELLQNFVTSKVLESGILSRADPAAGKFRTFLLAALGNYLIDTVRARNAKKRTADREALEIDAERDHLQDPREEPSAAFEAAWARQVVDRAVELAKQECDASGRPALFGVLEARVISPCLDGTVPTPYDELVSKFHLTSPEQASNLLVTAKRTFVRALRNAIAEYAGEENVDQELQDLRHILARG